MLTLTRNIGETIRIGDKVEVTVAEVRGNTVRLSINAPREIRILREEVHQRITQANRIAAQVAADAAGAIAAAIGAPASAAAASPAPQPTENPQRVQPTEPGPSGWTHAQAKQHSLVERLLERCAVYGGAPCHSKSELAHDDWCERCLAAEALVQAGL